jgi:protein-tyrosine phosphatase
MRPKRERILFVCTANIDRSPTAESLYAGDPRYEVLSAGVAPFATVPINQRIMEWADRIFVMCEREDHHKSELQKRFPKLERPIVDLDVEDRWYRGDPELVQVLLARLEPHLGKPQKDE